MSCTPESAARRAFMAAMVIGALAATTSSLAQVGEKAVRIVLPNATGSGVDTITRTVQPALAKALGMAVVIENQPGAGGIVGVQTLTRAVPDGMTLGVVSNNVVIFPSVYKTLPFELPADLTPIAIVGFTPVVLVVNPKVPAKTAKELAALMKSKNGDFNYGSSGNGTILHLAAEMFVDEAGAKAKHIPYKGVGPMLTDLIGGQVEMATAALPSVQSHLKSGALRAIGVGAAQRVPAAPDIPTMTEQGIPMDLTGYFSLLAPAGVPKPILDQLAKWNNEVVALPETKAFLNKFASDPWINAMDDAQGYFLKDIANWANYIRIAKIEPQG